MVLFFVVVSCVCFFVVLLLLLLLLVVVVVEEKSSLVVLSAHTHRYDTYDPRMHYHAHLVHYARRETVEERVYDCKRKQKHE